MGNGFQFFDIILLAMIAGFLILRLRSVLGRRDGHEGGYRDPFRKDKQRQQEEAPDNVIPLPDRESAETAEPAAADQSPLDAALTRIQLADPDFDPDQFIGGARAAFEMILNAFASGDRDSLRSLLDDEVFENFTHSIEEREKAGQTLDETLVGIRKAEIAEASLEDRVAYVTVKFVSDQVTVLRDAEGEIVEGDPDHVSEVVDYWTFARDTSTDDPNWLLVATQSPEDE